MNGYLNRIVPAQMVLNRPGSVVFWQNCRHPFYDDNPFKDKAPKGRPWVGNFWDLFYAGHTRWSSRTSSGSSSSARPGAP